MYLKKDIPIINIGEYSFKKNRIFSLYKYCVNKYPNQIENIVFSRKNYQKIYDALAILSKEYHEDILSFYEGNYVYNKCLRLLSIRPRSRKEMRDYIRRSVINEESIEIVLKKIDSFLDDEKFAEYLVQKEHGRNPKGNKMLRLLLKAKGIDEDIINSFCLDDEMEYIETQYNRKKTILYDRLKRKGKLKEFNMKMRMYLLSKGFKESNISSYLKDHEMDSKA